MIDLMKVQPHLYVLYSSTIGGLFELFGNFGAIFGVMVRFKILLETYLHKQSTLDLEVKAYLFVFNLAPFGAFLLQ